MNYQALAGRVAVVTGAASGMGAATAELLAANGGEGRPAGPPSWSTRSPRTVAGRWPSPWTSPPPRAGPPIW